MDVKMLMTHENWNDNFRELNKRNFRKKEKNMYENLDEERRVVRRKTVDNRVNQDEQKLEEEVIVDDEAKISVPLYMHEDRYENVFYTGKLQFNGSLDLTEGQNFMLFLSEENAEEMQIGPLDPSRSSSMGESVTMSPDGRISVKLKRHKDRGGHDIFIGELKGPASIPMKKGLFFTVFTSDPGREEIQIKPLNLEKAKKKRQYRESFKVAHN